MSDHALTRFGQISRELRIKKKMTMADQHRDLGYLPSQITKYETGVETPNLKYVNSFSKWIGAGLLDHQNLIRTSFLSASRSSIKMTKSEGNRLFRTVNSLKPDQVRKLGLKVRGKDG